MSRRSSRLRGKKRVNYGEEALWEKEVRRAQVSRAGIEKKRAGRARKLPKVPLKRKVNELRRPRPPSPERGDDGGYMPWEQPGYDPAAPEAGEDWNRVLEKPQERVERFVGARKATRPQPVFKPVPMTKKRKHLLFMNPGDGPLTEAAYALGTGGGMPGWATPFLANLHMKVDRLYFRDALVDLPMAFQAEKRDAVKRLYFDPREPSTIQPISDALYDKWANVSKANVTHVLKSLETYQRNFGRRIPPKIASRTLLRQPGILAIDMFFPSAQLGWWGKFNVLCCMDTWSRFCRAYALEHKDYESTKAALSMFLQEFASFGFLPRRILADKGSDLAPAKELMERYRTARDRDGPMVLHTKTGQPVLIVEALNAQVQRRMQVFRTARLTDDPSVILEDITDQLNNQKRPSRGNLTPLQLLGLTGAERAAINEQHRDKAFGGLETGLTPLKVGHTVRILLWDRKEQVKGGLGARFKGFAPKWSKRTYTVAKRRALSRNPGVFTYSVGLHQEYFRHELLKIPKVVDRDVPQGLVEHRQHVVAPQEAEWEQEWRDDEKDPGGWDA